MLVFKFFLAFFDQLVAANTKYYVFVKGTVFFVCFLGKLFLILFLYTFIKIKWIHAAIITLMAHEGTPLELAIKMNAISNSIDKVNNEIKA